MDNNRVGRFDRASVGILNFVDSLFYALVGVAFLGAAGLTLIYSVVNLVVSVSLSLSQQGGFTFQIAQDILGFVSDLLLVLIILEVLGTIRSYLEKRANSVQPFLFIGIISATRSILSTGARLSIVISGTSASLGMTDFRNDIIELGISALVIIALGVTVRIMGPYATISVEDNLPKAMPPHDTQPPNA